MGAERERWLRDLIDAYDRIRALEDLLVCYRLGKQPSEKLHKELERTKTAVRSRPGSPYSSVRAPDAQGGR